MSNNNTQLTVVEKNGKIGLAQRVGLGLGAMTLSAGAFAADDWSAGIVTTITGAVSTVSAIGLAVLTLFVTAKVFKWVKTAM